MAGGDGVDGVSCRARPGPGRGMVDCHMTTCAAVMGGWVAALALINLSQGPWTGGQLDTQYQNWREAWFGLARIEASSRSATSKVRSTDSYSGY